MQRCAFCDQPCKPTREHVIPDWYGTALGKSATFSAKAPLTHLKGDLIVRDVCSSCNNGELSKLDSYAKELYQSCFYKPIFDGETVPFKADGDLLLRWLLKVSYNSARAQNADWLVLREYRKVILGQSPWPDRIRCWVNVISSTVFDENSNIYRPARREERNHSSFFEPHWFRICQVRLHEFPADLIVQRAVMINSFNFTLLIDHPNCAWPSSDFKEWIRLFTSAHATAKCVLPEANTLTLTPDWGNAVESLHGFLSHYSSRYSGEPDPYVTAALKGDLKEFILRIPKALIDQRNPAPVIEILQNMVSTRENVLAFRQRVDLQVDGFNNDSRGLWQIPEVREFLRHVFKHCHFIMVFSNPSGYLFKVLAACWIYDERMTKQIELDRSKDFFIRAFDGLNKLAHTIMLSEEQNYEIGTKAMEPFCEIFG